HVVLKHVANSARLIIEFAAILDTKTFSHSDLNAIDIDTVPYRFKHGIRKPRIKYVLHRLFAEVVIDPEYVFLRKEAGKNAIELACRLSIAAKRLFDDKARVNSLAVFREALGNSCKKARGNGEIMQRPLRVVQFLAQLRIGRRIVVVAIHVA